MRRSGCGCLPWVVLLLVLGAIYWQMMIVAAVFGFLTLRRGDVESDYFEAYTETQKAFRDTYAEDVAMVVYDRWGER